MADPKKQGPTTRTNAWRVPEHDLRNARLYASDWSPGIPLQRGSYLCVWSDNLGMRDERQHTSRAVHALDD